MAMVLALANGGAAVAAMGGAGGGARQQQPWRNRPLCAPCGAVKPSPKGFGKPIGKKKQQRQRSGAPQDDDDDDNEAGYYDDDDGDDVVPEVVTNRMLRRMGFTVGIPMAVGVLFFGLYYYLKAVKKLEVPDWLPVGTSFLTFGASALGISYAVVSSSWDPQREGTLLGWKEARANWPMLWQGKAGSRDGDRDLDRD